MKHLCTRLLIATLAIGLMAVDSRAALTDGLVSYWGFESDLVDTSPAGHENNGTFVGNGDAAFAPGRFGDALDLTNGADGTDGRRYVEIPETDTLKFAPEEGGDGNISISAWFTVESFTKNWQALIAQGEDRAWRVARRGDSSPGIMSYAGGIGDIPGDNSTGPAVDDGEWHHVVVITEQDVSTRLWVDGDLVATGGAPTLEISRDIPEDGVAPPHTGNGPIFIGDNPDTGDRSWDGLIDDVGIWDRVLTEAEIAEIWNDGEGTVLVVGGHPGDANGDGTTNRDDFDIISGNFGLAPASREEGNVTGSSAGGVTLADFRVWKNNDGTSAPPEAAGAVPEPSSVALAVLAVAAGLSMTRRRNG